MEFYTSNNTFIPNELVINGTAGEVTMGIGFGLRPDLTGRDFGEEFVSACVNFARAHYNYSGKIMLGVAVFNQRAKKVYERVGFEPIETIQASLGDQTYEIIRMQLAE